MEIRVEKPMEFSAPELRCARFSLTGMGVMCWKNRP
jgi:hypothetical protein